MVCLMVAVFYTCSLFQVGACIVNTDTIIVGIGYDGMSNGRSVLYLFQVGACIGNTDNIIVDIGYDGLHNDHNGCSVLYL